MTDFFDDTEARRQARKKRDWELTKEQSQRLLAWEPPPRYRPLRASTSAQPQRENAAGVTNVTPDGENGEKKPKQFTPPSLTHLPRSKVSNTEAFGRRVRKVLQEQGHFESGIITG